jgi:3-isopropylmalate/(R)-2-methylmalate dehydratase small subunit
MNPVRQVLGRSVALPADNIDTDRIIPARFLTTTQRDGLGQHAFHDWRYRADGSLNPDFALNAPAAQGASVLIAGHNFGCGSSREHAPWALLDAGYRAVVSSAIADIFRNNALTNGLLAVVVSADVHARLLASAPQDVRIDVEAQTLTAGDTTSAFALDPFVRQCLLDGVDELGYLLQRLPMIEQWEARA